MVKVTNRMNKITKLSRNQLAAMEAYRAEWLAIGRSTATGEG